MNRKDNDHVTSMLTATRQWPCLDPYTDQHFAGMDIINTG